MLKIIEGIMPIIGRLTLVATLLKADPALAVVDNEAGRISSGGGGFFVWLIVAAGLAVLFIVTDGTGKLVFTAFAAFIVSGVLFGPTAWLVGMVMAAICFVVLCFAPDKD